MTQWHSCSKHWRSWLTTKTTWPVEIVDMMTMNDSLTELDTSRTSKQKIYHSIERTRIGQQTHWNVVKWLTIFRSIRNRWHDLLPGKSKNKTANGGWKMGWAVVRKEQLLLKRISNILKYSFKLALARLDVDPLLYRQNTSLSFIKLSGVRGRTNSGSALLLHTSEPALTL